MYGYVYADPVNWIDPWGLATVDNQTGGPLRGGSNDSGTHEQVEIPEGISEDIDTDSLDFDGDGIAEQPFSKKDLHFLPLSDGEKIPGKKPNCPKITVTRDECGKLKTHYNWVGCSDVDLTLPNSP